MECTEAQRLLQATADGEAGAADSVRLERHLEDCDGCVEVLRNLQSLRHAVQHGATRYRAPADLHERIAESLTSLPASAVADPPDAQAEPGWRRWFR